MDYKELLEGTFIVNRNSGGIVDWDHQQQGLSFNTSQVYNKDAYSDKTRNASNVYNMKNNGGS